MPASTNTRRTAKLIKTWGEPGTDPGQFNIVHNIVTDADGWVYVADRENHRVQVFDGNGKYETQWNNLHRPCALHCCGGKHPNFIIGELGPGMPVNRKVPNLGPRLTIVDAKGKRIARLGGENGPGLETGKFLAPHGIALDSKGDIYVGEVGVTNWKTSFPDTPMPPEVRVVALPAEAGEDITHRPRVRTRCSVQRCSAEPGPIGFNVGPAQQCTAEDGVMHRTARMLTLTVSLRLDAGRLHDRPPAFGFRLLKRPQRLRRLPVRRRGLDAEFGQVLHRRIGQHLDYYAIQFGDDVLWRVLLFIRPSPSARMPARFYFWSFPYRGNQISPIASRRLCSDSSA